MTVDQETSLVPLTEGRVRTSGQMALVLFFPDGQQDERAAAFHRTLTRQQVRRLPPDTDRQQVRSDSY